MANWQFWTLIGVNTLFLAVIAYSCDLMARVLQAIEFNTRKY